MAGRFIGATWPLRFHTFDLSRQWRDSCVKLTSVPQSAVPNRHGDGPHSHAQPKLRAGPPMLWSLS